VSAIRSKKWRWAGAGTATAALVAGMFAGTSTATAATPAITPHQIKVSPDLVRLHAPNAQDIFSCQPNPIDFSQGPRCYVPQQMRTAYGVAPLVNGGLNGAGRTIVIIDAFQDPYLAGDLHIFDETFGLPDPSFTQVAPQGVPPYDPNNKDMVGWGGEQTLDVEWSHAIAPGAKIVLVQSASDQDADIYNAMKWAVDNNVGDVISMSFGEAETCLDPTLLREEHQLFGQATAKGITLFASSGDSGASQYNCAQTAAIKAASTPASDPYVTGVGGTTLNATDPAGNYVGETAWTELIGSCNPPATAPSDINCSGGGFSTLFARPSWQTINAPGSGRGVPDVSYDAGVNGGVIIYCSGCGGPASYYLSGGTSAGSPQWAAITAIGDQMLHRRLGWLNPNLYKIGKLGSGYNTAFHDVTTGDNFVSEINSGYNAGTNWDPVTGLGTPIAYRLLSFLANMPPAS